MAMDYSPWSEREIWPFLRVPVSPKPKKPCPPKSVYLHVTSIPTCMNFWSQFRLIKFFEDHGLLLHPLLLSLSIIAGQNEVGQWVWPLYTVIPNRKWSESQTKSEGLLNGQEVINNHY